MAALTREQVRSLARLARLDFEEAGWEAVSRDLNRMLALFAQLERYDVDGVPPTAHVIDPEGGGREDTISPGLSPEEALAAAPARERDFFRVPRVLR